MNIYVMGKVIGTASHQEWIDTDGAVFQCEGFVPNKEVTKAPQSDTIAFDLEAGVWTIYDNDTGLVKETGDIL